MHENLIEYLPILIFIAFSIIICIGFVISAFVVGNQNPDPEKNAPFECGFDVFEEPYPNTKYSNEKKQREHWIKTAGPSSISAKQLRYVFSKQKINNFELVSGDVLKTIPKYLKTNKNLKISLLNIDLAFVEPTKCALDYLYDKVVKGGVILFDNYGESYLF